MNEDWNQQWDSLKKVISEHGQGCIAVQVNGLKRMREFAASLCSIANNVNHSSKIIEFDTTSSFPQEILQKIKHSTADWNENRGLTIIISTAPVFDPKRVSFWKNINFCRESFEAIPFQIIFFLSSDEYTLFLTEADHFADWCMLRVDLTVKSELIESSFIIEQTDVDPHQAKKALVNLGTLLLKDSEAGIDQKKLIDRYYLPMFFLATEAQDFKRADTLRSKFREDEVPASLNKKWAQYNIEVDYKIGKYESAKEKSDSIISSINGLGNKTSVEELYFAGTILQSICNFKEAVDFFKQALSMQQIRNKGESSDTAIILNSIGICCLEIGDFLSAKVFFEQAIDNLANNNEQQSPLLAGCYDGLGLTYKSSKHFGNALDCFKKALSIDKDIFGNTHLSVARDHNNIGATLIDAGNHKEAIIWLTKAYEIISDVFKGQPNSYLAMTYNNLGSAYTEAEDYPIAQKYFTNSLDIAKTIYGESSSEVATCYNNLSFVMQYQGNFNEASDYLKKSYSIFKHLYGKDDPKALLVSKNLDNLMKEIVKNK